MIEQDHFRPLQRVAIESPLTALDPEGSETRDAARKPDAIDDAGIRRVGHDHFPPVGCSVISKPWRQRKVIPGLGSTGNPGTRSRR